MDTFELKKEQERLSRRVETRDDFSTVKTIAGVDCVAYENKLLATVVTCKYPSLEIIEVKSYTLHDPLPYKPGFVDYREMPAMIEAVNSLEEDPDMIIVNGVGISHPRIGLASHLGLVINKPTIGVSQKLLFGKIEEGKIISNNRISGFEVTTREHAKPVYVTPGHLIGLGSSLNFVKETIRHPHKLPEPLHLAHKFAKKKVRKVVPRINHQT